MFADPDTQDSKNIFNPFLPRSLSFVSWIRRVANGKTTYLKHRKMGENDESGLYDRSASRGRKSKETAAAEKVNSTFDYEGK